MTRFTRQPQRGTHRGRFLSSRGHQRRRGAPGRPSNGYSWSTFHQEDYQDGEGSAHLPNMRAPPPRLIPTIHFDEEKEPAPSNSDGSPQNLCARWLAKNPHFNHKQRPAEVVLDDSELTPSGSDGSEDIIVLDEDPVEHEEELEEIIEISEDDDSVVVIEEVSGMSTTTWSEPTSSGSTSSKMLQKLNDCFSRECDAYQRVPRRWAAPPQVQRPLSSASTTSTFTVCSYNVLCQKTILRTSHLYRHLNNGSQQFLEWEYRWKGLRSELPTFDADILGLQEVQADHFEQDFGPFMTMHGYEGVYKRKYGTEQKDDGCALFYRPEKFEKVAYQDVNYFVSAEATSNRENVGQILALKCRFTQEMLLIANTHLLFNQERGDVKLAQLAILFAFLHEMRENLARGQQHKPVVLVMGDFNMELHSKVYDFVVQGKLHIDGQYVRTLSGQSGRPGGKVCQAVQLLNTTNIGLNSQFYPKNAPAPMNTGKLTHPFKFRSAYHFGAKKEIFEQRAVSTFHKEAAAPDFIFFTPEFQNGSERLRLLETFALPTMDSLLRAIPWPNQHVPSDHLPLIAKFRLTGK